MSEKDDLKFLEKLLETAEYIANKPSINNIYYEPVPIADRIASIDHCVNYGELIAIIKDYVSYEIEQLKEEIN